MFVTTTTMYVVFCVLGLQTSASRVELQFDRFQKVWTDLVPADDYLLSRECSATPSCSLLNCARLCGSKPACKSFSFGTADRACLLFTVRSPGSTGRDTALINEGWATWEKDEPDPCMQLIHGTLQDDYRDIGFSSSMGPWESDHHLSPGWYRFLVENAIAEMVMSCQSRNTCGTYNPVWLDLQGNTLPREGQQVAVRGCGGQQGHNCCSRQVPVTVLNCSTFLVYKLVATNINHRYCPHKVGG